MATQLKNVLTFANVAGGATVALAHELQVDGRAVAPSLIAPGPGGNLFTISADATDVTVINTTGGPQSVSVYVERWHSIESAFGDVAVKTLPGTPFLINAAQGLLSEVEVGNTVTVDEVFGNDATGQRQGLPFATVQAALAVAQAGDVVKVRPGTYTLPAAGITVPDNVSLEGESVDIVTLQILNATADTTLVTLGNLAHIHNATLRLTSAGHHELVGVRFTDGTAHLDSVEVYVDNSGAGAGASDVIGVLDGAVTGTPVVDNLLHVYIEVSSTGGGIKRGVRITSATALTAAALRVLMVGTGIGIETAHAGAVFTGQGITVDGVTADVSQTLGTLRVGAGSFLVNHNANGLGLTALTVPSITVWADPGGLPAGATRYLRPGTEQVSATEVFVYIPQGTVIFQLSVQATAPPGGAVVNTFTVRKNGVDTALTVTLTGAQTSNLRSDVSVTFAAGDRLSIKVVTGGGSSTSDVVVVPAMY